jgi:ketopantoate reductase
MSRNILVVGTGAIGGFYASRLSTVPGTRVSAICRSNYDAIRKNGIKVSSPIFGHTSFTPTYTFTSADEAKATKKREGLLWDYLIVTTKVLGDPSALLEGLVGKDSSIVVFQNGLGIEEPYRKRFSENPIISAVTRYVEHPESSAMTSVLTFSKHISVTAYTWSHRACTLDTYDYWSLHASHIAARTENWTGQSRRFRISSAQRRDPGRGRSLAYRNAVCALA